MWPTSCFVTATRHDLSPFVSRLVINSLIVLEKKKKEREKEMKKEMTNERKKERKE